MIRLKDNEGGALLVNPQFVVLVNSVKAKSDLGAPQLVIGKCALVMSTGITLVVNHTVEEVYGLLRRPVTERAEVLGPFRQDADANKEANRRVMEEQRIVR